MKSSPCQGRHCWTVGIAVDIAEAASPGLPLGAGLAWAGSGDQKERERPCPQSVAAFGQGRPGRRRQEPVWRSHVVPRSQGQQWPGL